VTGIAKGHGAGAHPRGKPALVPAAPTDYTTGYLAAFGAMAGLARRAKEGGSYHVRVSLSRSSMFIQRFGEFPRDAYSGELVHNDIDIMQHCSPHLSSQL
jgi:crotonobetainyl-CoA:carnitine CoA-transferase CaiB-like acyl-CoA transferase